MHMKALRPLFYDLHVAERQRRQKRYAKRAKVENPFAWALEMPNGFDDDLTSPHGRIGYHMLNGTAFTR